MTVKELIQKLGCFDPEHSVMVTTDNELPFGEYTIDRLSYNGLVLVHIGDMT